MKVLFILLFIPCVLFGQNKMTGIGVFKFDSTTVKIIDSISTISGVKIKTSSSSMETSIDDTWLDEKTSKIYLLSKSDEKDKYGFTSYPDPNYVESKDVSVYYINSFVVAGIPLQKLYLFFYKDTLYKLECYGSLKLTEAMDIKYGKRKIETDVKTITCRSGLGVEYTQEEKTYYQHWNINNPSLYCLGLLLTYFDDKCKKQSANSFQVRSQKTHDLVGKEISDAKDKEKKDAEKKKKAQLNDF